MYGWMKIHQMSMRPDAVLQNQGLLCAHSIRQHSRTAGWKSNFFQQWIHFRLDLNPLFYSQWIQYKYFNSVLAYFQLAYSSLKTLIRNFSAHLNTCTFYACTFQILILAHFKLGHFQIPSEYLPDTFQTPPRHARSTSEAVITPTITFWTPYKHPLFL